MNKYSRRDILKLGLAGLGAAVLRPQGFAKAYLPDFPIAPRLGRTFYTVDIKSKPDPESTTIKTVYNDSVLILNREVIGKTPTMYWRNRRWFETPEGFIPAISVQPVENNPAQPVSELPVYGEGWGIYIEDCIIGLYIYILFNSSNQAVNVFYIILLHITFNTFYNLNCRIRIMEVGCPY